MQVSHSLPVSYLSRFPPLLLCFKYTIPHLPLSLPVLSLPPFDSTLPLPQHPFPPSLPLLPPSLPPFPYFPFSFPRSTCIITATSSSPSATHFPSCHISYQRSRPPVHPCPPFFLSLSPPLLDRWCLVTALSSCLLSSRLSRCLPFYVISFPCLLPFSLLVSPSSQPFYTLPCRFLSSALHKTIITTARHHHHLSPHVSSTHLPTNIPPSPPIHFL